MGKKITREKVSGYTHDQCAHVSERYNKGFSGKFICGRCPYNRYAFLLSDNACTEHFKMKVDEKGDKG